MLLRVTAGSYQHSNNRAIFSDDSLKCYHYTVDIQKNLNGEGAHPPPQTPLPTRRCAPRLATFGRSSTIPPKPRTKSPPMRTRAGFTHAYKRWIRSSVAYMSAVQIKTDRVPLEVPYLLTLVQ